MTDSSILPGSLVWYAPKGLGRVRDIGDSSTVLFWSDMKAGTVERVPTSLLTPLASFAPSSADDGSSEEFESWAKKSPIKLVALALVACGGAGSNSDIRQKLSGKVPLSPNWGSWWKRNQPKLGNLPDHFRISSEGDSTTYALLSSLMDVPQDWTEPRSASLADWKGWLSADTHDPPPGRFPTKPVVDALAKWDANSVEQTLLRLMVASEQLSSAGDLSPQAAEGWLRALAQAIIRRLEIGGIDTRGYTAARAGEALARLARIAGDRAPQDLLLQAGIMDGETDAWRRGFVAGLWEAFAGDDAREMYSKSSAVLGRQARTDLARELALAAFDPGYSARRNFELDRLLDLLPEEQRKQILREMVASATVSQKEAVLDYIGNSRHASGPELLGLRMMAILALADPKEDSAKLEGTLKAGDSDFNGLLQVANPEPLLHAIQKDHYRDMESLQQSHASEIERKGHESEQLRQQISHLGKQVQERNAELDAKRVESRLEIRQDMLLAVGEVLQSMYLRQQGGESSATVEAGLTLALRAGGADLLEAPGEIVQFKPQWHQAIGDSTVATLVKVLAPGVIVRGGVHGDRVLLKAQVTHEAD